jgi:hypothetical protein
MPLSGHKAKHVCLLLVCPIDKGGKKHFKGKNEKKLKLSAFRVIFLMLDKNSAPYQQISPDNDCLATK